MEISESLLIKLAGLGAYERGLGYFEEGRVCSLESSQRKTTAVVNGSQPYRVELRHTQRQLDGACDCPASDGIDFCKHCVAVALAVRENLEDGAREGGGSDRQKIATYLAAQDRESLVKLLMEALPKASTLEQRLLLEAEAAQGAVSLRQLKKWIAQVTRPRQLWDYREVAAYFARIGAVLENIHSISEHIPAKTMLATALYGISRVDNALLSVDDSSGYRYAVQESLLRMHILALQRLGEPHEASAAHILELAIQDPWDQFAGVPGTYAQAFGQGWLDAFYVQVESALSTLPPPDPRVDDEDQRVYRRLVYYLQERAEAAEDWDTLIDLEEPLATAPHHFERLAALCLRKRDPDAAEQWLIKADALNSRKDAHPSDFWVNVHILREDWQGAVEAQRGVLEREPSLEEYELLMDCAARAGCSDDVRADVEDLLSSTAKRPWMDERYAFTLAQIYQQEQDWLRVHAAVHGRVDDADRLQKAARWLAEPAPELACDIFRDLVAALIKKGSNKHRYKGAVDALLEARPVFKSVDPAKFNAFVAELRATHRMKRNLMSALDKAL